MNLIKTEQNKKKYLRMHYSARICYNFAEVINGLIWLFCILGYILNNIPSFKTILGDILPFVSAGMTICIFIGGELLGNKAVKLGAAFRKYIDYNLFCFKAENYYGYDESELIDMSLFICNLRKKDSMIRLQNTGNDSIKGVKEWYVDIDSIEDRQHLIFKCQKQNSWFDKKITKIQQVAFLIILILIITDLLIMNFNKTLSTIVLSILPATSLIIKIVKELIMYKKYNDLMMKIDFLKKTISNITDEKIMQMQNLIDERRSMNFVSINLLHDLLSIKLHDRHMEIGS